MSFSTNHPPRTPISACEPLEPRRLLATDANVLTGTAPQSRSGNFANAGDSAAYTVRLEHPGWFNLVVAEKNPHGTDQVKISGAGLSFDRAGDRILYDGIAKQTAANRLPAGDYSVTVTRNTARIPNEPASYGDYSLAVLIDYAGKSPTESSARDGGTLFGSQTFTDFAGDDSASATQDRVDAYRFNAITAKTIEATVTASGSLAHAHLSIMQLVNGKLQVIKTVYGSTGGSIILASPVPPGNVFLQFSNNFSPGLPYTLRVGTPSTAALQVAPNTIGFNPTTIRLADSSQITITNNGPASFTLSGTLKLPPKMPFELGATSFSLASGQSVSIPVTYKPKPGLKFTDSSGLTRAESAQITITSNDPARPVTKVALTGVAKAAQPINFSAVALTAGSAAIHYLILPGNLAFENHFQSDSGVVSDLLASWAPKLLIRENLSIAGSQPVYTLPLPFRGTLPNPAGGYVRACWGRPFGQIYTAGSKSNDAYFADVQGFTGGVPFTSFHNMPLGEATFSVHQIYEFHLGPTLQKEGSNLVTSEPWTSFGNAAISEITRAIHGGTFMSIRGIRNQEYIYTVTKNGASSSRNMGYFPVARP